MEVLVARTLIHPSDLDASIAFYRDQLGLAIAREFGEGEQRGVVFHTGGGLLEVTGGSPRSRQDPPRAEQVPGGSSSRAGTGGTSVVLWFQVRDLAATVAALEGRGITLVRRAQLEPWGLLEAWIADPDGLRIHLVEVPATHPLRRDSRDLSQAGGTEQAGAVP